MTNALPALVLCALALQGCGFFGTEADVEAREVVVIEDYGRFDREAIQIAPFEIERADVEGDRLRLRVSYGGGCAEHAFTLYSTRGIHQSYPPQADVYLSHDGGGDTCKALISEELRFDLSPLMHPSEPGALLLRLHPYKETEPIRPLLRYEYR